MQVRAGLAGVEHRMGVPDTVLERSAAVMSGRESASGWLVLDLANPLNLAWACFGDECTFPSSLLDKVVSDMAELGGKVRMDEEYVHRPVAPGQVACATIPHLESNHRP
jgi:hypothetical protein